MKNPVFCIEKNKNPHKGPSNQPLMTNPQVIPSRRETLKKFDYPFLIQTTEQGNQLVRNMRSARRGIFSFSIENFTVEVLKKEYRHSRIWICTLTASNLRIF